MGKSIKPLTGKKTSLQDIIIPAGRFFVIYIQQFKVI